MSKAHLAMNQGGWFFKRGTYTQMKCDRMFLAKFKFFPSLRIEHSCRNILSHFITKITQGNLSKNIYPSGEMPRDRIVKTCTCLGGSI